MILLGSGSSIRTISRQVEFGDGSRDLGRFILRQYIG
jgi:hypothetical protein